MVRHTLEYPKDVQNTVNRYKHQGIFPPFLFLLPRYLTLQTLAFEVPPFSHLSSLPLLLRISTLSLMPLPAVYALQTIHTIINTTPVLHVSFTPSPDDPFPVILPMIGQMASFSRPSAGLGEPLECYLHGYVSSRIMNLYVTIGAICLLLLFEFSSLF